jgi:hypothetical protein
MTATGIPTLRPATSLPVYASLVTQSRAFASISTSHSVARSRFQQAADTVRDASGCWRRVVYGGHKTSGRPPHQFLFLARPIGSRVGLAMDLLRA